LLGGCIKHSESSIAGLESDYSSGVNMGELDLAFALQVIFFRDQLSA